jgi:probable F420-dependent oxidoreductase
MVKPFRFGVQCGGDRDRADLEQLARKIEALGYSTFYVPDHFIDTQMAPIIAMAVAAEATATLRVGALVFDNDYKHPAILAKEIATLDRLSDGRVELGIGAGWMKVDYEALGLAYDPAGVRVDRLEEALAVIKGCWASEAFSFDGAHYTITEYNGIPKPTQQPRPPILVGGGGPRVLRLAGREADIVGINPNLRAGTVTNDAATNSVAEMVDQKVDWIREGAGARFDDLELQIRFFFAAITDDRQALAAAAAPGFGLDAEAALESGIACIGTIDEICDQLQRRRDRWGVSYAVIGDDIFEAFAPVVERLAGT